MTAGAASFEYAGSELELFEKARNWKAYWSGRIIPYVTGDVLEVGAGIGANSMLLGRACRSWTCLEPDPALAREIRGAGRVIVGQTSDLNPSERFDAILYIDVLEHIKDDTGEITRAVSHLRPRGHLIVVAPAHSWLYAPFDAAVGHFRRYSRASLRAAATRFGLREVDVAYLDSVGLLASSANRLLLRQSLPTARQIAIWDRLMVPLSRVLDPVLAHRIGKSIVGIWTSLG